MTSRLTKIQHFQNLMAIVLGIGLESLLNTSLFASKAKEPAKLEKAEQTLGNISANIFNKFYWTSAQKDEHIKLAGELADVTNNDYRIMIVYLHQLLTCKENSELFKLYPLNAYREPIKFQLAYLIEEFKIDIEKHKNSLEALPFQSW